MAKYTVVMARHGESEWNLKNLFCGWYDAELSAKGTHSTIVARNFSHSNESECYETR